MLYSKNFEELLENLNDFAQWYRSKFKISIEGSRLQEVIRLIKKLEDARKNNTLQEVIYEEGMENLYFPLYDAGSFPIIKEAFSSYKLGPLRKKDLEDIIRGPFNPFDEEKGTKDVTPRNKLFELFLAALIKLAGIEIIAFDDIHFEINSRKVFVECKRLGSANKERIENNLNKACDQIDKKIKTCGQKNSRGIIALSIEKIMPFYEQNKALPSREDGSTFLKNEMGFWFKKNYDFLWGKIIDRRIVALIIFSRYLALDPSSNMITTHNNTIFASRTKNRLKIGDNNLVQAISDKMHLSIEGY